MTSTFAPVSQAYVPSWTFGDRLRKARGELGATQREFAAALEVKHPTYAAWESDRVSCPQQVALAKRIEVLSGVRATWLLGLDEPAPSPGGDGGSRQRGVPGTMTTCSPRNRLHVVPEPDVA